MPNMVLNFRSDEIKNAKNEAEEEWALNAAMKVYGEAVDRVLNPLIGKYNELWPDEISAIDESGYIIDEAPYNKRYEEYQKLAYDAMSYIFGVNPKTHRIVKLDPPYISIYEDRQEGVVFAHIEDFEM